MGAGRPGIALALLIAVSGLPATAAVLAGKERALDSLKGHVMRACKGRADPAVVDALLRAQLELLRGHTP